MGSLSHQLVLAGMLAVFSIAYVAVICIAVGEVRDGNKIRMRPGRHFAKKKYQKRSNPE